jgi:hypothetical protein
MTFHSEDDGFFAGAVRFKNVKLNSGAVDNAAVNSSADIAASKMTHQHRATHTQELATTPTTGSYVIHAFHGATGGVLAAKFGMAVKPTGDGTVTLNLLNKTTSILSEAITLNSSSTNYTFQAGTIATSAATAGDVIVLSIASSTGTAGTCGGGLFAYADVLEDYQ